MVVHRCGTGRGPAPVRICIVELADENRAAERRGVVAQQIAAAVGRRFDGALAKLAGARAAICDRAMSAVSQLLKDLKQLEAVIGGCR